MDLQLVVEPVVECAGHRHIIAYFLQEGPWARMVARKRPPTQKSQSPMHRFTKQIRVMIAIIQAHYFEGIDRAAFQ